MVLVDTSVFIPDSDHLNNVESLLKLPLKIIPSGRPRQRAVSEAQDDSDSDFNFTDVLRELRTELDVRKREEAKLEKEIAAALAEGSAAGFEQSRTFAMAVSKLNNSLLVVESDAKQLATSLATISRLADNISGKVVDQFSLAKQDVVKGFCT
ncbi:unnamed protein product [Auanema sp. JU1783]|nr:unnamed protein product [Auanema sp. JU1783]